MTLAEKADGRLFTTSWTSLNGEPMLHILVDSHKGDERFKETHLRLSDLIPPKDS